jgi:catechol 2,3-dioxygenase-like lactoylglutathione lyase family enzyme
MLDHVKILVTDLDASAEFYEKALAPIGYKLIMKSESGFIGFGAGFPDFWLEPALETARVHVAFRVDSTAAVDEFHAAAVAAGGTDNGAPGPRPYHPEYYGAFVLDPDGHNIEACNHGSLFE